MQVLILQAANSSGGATEALVDYLKVAAGTSTVLLEDPFEPPGPGPGANWVAATATGVANLLQSTRVVSDDRWHHVAITYDQAPAGSVEVYIDGVLDISQKNSAAWSWVAARQIELGRSHDPSWRAFDGFLDEVRIYNRRLTAAEVAQAATSAGPLVDPAAVMVRFSFDAAPSGYTLTWPGGGFLESTTELDPPAWTLVPGSRTPYYVRPSEAPLKFYRALGP